MRDDDVISFALLDGEIKLHVTNAELETRRAANDRPPVRHTRGYLADFAATVTQANEGCVNQWVMDKK